MAPRPANSAPASNKIFNFRPHPPPLTDAPPPHRCGPTPSLYNSARSFPTCSLPARRVCFHARARVVAFGTTSVASSLFPVDYRPPPPAGARRTLPYYTSLLVAGAAVLASSHPTATFAALPPAHDRHYCTITTKLQYAGALLHATRISTRNTSTRCGRSRWPAPRSSLPRAPRPSAAAYPPETHDAPARPRPRYDAHHCRLALQLLPIANAAVVASLRTATSFTARRLPLAPAALLSITTSTFRMRRASGRPPSHSTRSPCIWRTANTTCTNGVRSSPPDTTTLSAIVLPLDDAHDARRAPWYDTYRYPHAQYAPRRIPIPSPDWTQRTENAEVMHSPCSHPHPPSAPANGARQRTVVRHHKGRHAANARSRGRRPGLSHRTVAHAGEIREQEFPPLFWNVDEHRRAQGKVVRECWRSANSDEHHLYILISPFLSQEIHFITF
ncbi:hypothetical protein C8R44DRAFT_893889 [Mycena epipterygia]|nr:hypothetical protein C8R44DRAFT_893889 [Mycena epipterygia]